MVQVAADAPALGVRGLDHTGARGLQCGLPIAALELGARARGEALQHRDVLRLGLYPPLVEHREVVVVVRAGVAQADREIQPHVARALVLGELLDQPLRERRERLPGHERARLADGVSYSNDSSIGAPA